jgi:two-component system response regulator BaeR
MFCAGYGYGGSLPDNDPGMGTVTPYQLQDGIRPLQPAAVHSLPGEVLRLSKDGMTLCRELRAFSQIPIMLSIFLRNPGRVFSRDFLLDQLDQDFRDVSDRVIDSHIKNLRKKLAPVIPERTVIHSIYGAGYKFDG